jgi:hypothetical protein
MDRIHYAGDSILTGTDIARALLDYAQALAQVGASATVDIPTIDAHGAPGRSEVLVGPSSQLLSNSEASEYDDVVDADLVADMTQKAEHLRHFGPSSTGGEVRPGELDQGWSDFDGI